ARTTAHSVPATAKTVTGSSTSHGLGASISTDAQVSTARSPGPARSSRRVYWIAAAVALVAVVGGGVMMSKRGPGGAASMSSDSTNASSAPGAGSPSNQANQPGAPSVVVRVPVRPPTAKVMIAGVARELEDGFLVLNGRPGESFVVVVENDGDRRE